MRTLRKVQDEVGADDKLMRIFTMMTYEMTMMMMTMMTMTMMMTMMMMMVTTARFGAGFHLKMNS